MQTSPRPGPGAITEHLPLLWITLACIGGILLADWLRLAPWAWLLLGLVSGLAGWQARRSMSQRRVVIPALALVTLVSVFLGAAYYELRQPRVNPFHIAFYNDRLYEVLVTGWVEEMPDRRDTYTNLRLRVEAVDTGTGDLRAEGVILVRVGENEVYHYGERIRVRGYLQTPPEDEEFSYRDYLARDGILSYMSQAEATRLPGENGNFITAAMLTLKEKMLVNIYRLFPDPEASLLAGILLGVDTGLTRELQDAFKNTGTAHIIAISGFNISIIAAIFVSMFSRMAGKRWGALLAVLAIAFYTLLVGADSAVVRAALMGGISLVAKQLGRRNIGLNALATAALVMILINPLVIQDIGFQLSVMATLGLILYAEPLSNLAGKLLSALRLPASTIEQVLPPISDFLLLTLAAQITTLPIMAYQFKRISLVSFISNPFVLPPQPAVMILGGLAVLISLFHFPLGQLAAWLTWPFVGYTIRMVEIFDRVPHGTIFLGDSSPWLVAGFYAALLSVTLGWPQIKEALSTLTKPVRAISAATLLALLFIGSLLVWRSIFNVPDGDLHITFLNVGSADAILIQTPSGKNVLINGGASASQLSDDLGRRLPLFARQLDWLIVASTTENQMAALPRVLERYPPQNVLWSGNIQASFSARQVDIWLAQNGIPVRQAETGQRLELGDGAFIEVLAVGPRGSVLFIQWKDFRALLPLGMDASTLEALEYGNVIGPVDVLLLADSGYFATNNVDWVQNLNPQVVVLSVAAGDPNGLPSHEALDAVGGYPLLRTDRNGWIKISTDGTGMRVDAEKE